MNPYTRGLSLVAFIVLSPASASAHGFGQRYDLPVPLGLFMLGAGASVVLSFLGMGLFVRRKRGERGLSELQFASLPPVRMDRK